MDILSFPLCYTSALSGTSTPCSLCSYLAVLCITHDIILGCTSPLSLTSTPCSLCSHLAPGGLIYSLWHPFFRLYFTSESHFHSLLTVFWIFRLYFTSESHIHSLLTVLTHGGLIKDKDDEQWTRQKNIIRIILSTNLLRWGVGG